MRENYAGPVGRERPEDIHIGGAVRYLDGADAPRRATSAIATRPRPRQTMTSASAASVIVAAAFPP